MTSWDTWQTSDDIMRYLTNIRDDIMRYLPNMRYLTSWDAMMKYLTPEMPSWDIWHQRCHHEIFDLREAIIFHIRDAIITYLTSGMPSSHILHQGWHHHIFYIRDAIMRYLTSEMTSWHQRTSWGIWHQIMQLSEYSCVYYLIQRDIVIHTKLNRYINSSLEQFENKNITSKIC